ncbi:hypothetical protein B0I35DRAFT_422775 [Stachybotrys elegans]|uniref:TNT domain-containing protein n=1 Tax=Stachybotrys elegans TaxID=80388 RepID=A0A8K0T0Z1_9HYPO|nr:hypothetical protein B0I35DRAFT_422775 [Stachybotrys elegans]
MKLFTALVWPLFVLSASASTLSRTLCDCRGTINGGSGSEMYICNDQRLGPRVLPRKLPLGTLTASYDRFGGLTPGQFLDKWWSTADNRWIFPEQNGFQLNTDSNGINGTTVLEPGTLVDRFGGEGGRFVSAADAPFSQRALPPSNLNTNASTPNFPYDYHIYRVVKPLTVVGGPIRPWFGQPGLGTQFFTGSTNINDLLTQGFLQREDPEILTDGKKNGCGI